MATWLVGHTPWLTLVRARLRLPSQLWLPTRSHLNQALSPASLEIETMPYPTTYPDASVFEPMSAEYTSVATRSHCFTPLTPPETLVSLVASGDFLAADELRKEMLAHHVYIPRKILYLRAALHAITRRHSTKGKTARKHLDAFEAWLHLAPERHETWVSFRYIRERLFRTIDHPDLPLVYRFGLVLARKGYYSGDAAIQVVLTISRHARPSDVERYLRQVEDAARDYHLKRGTDLPLDWLSGAYRLSIRTFTLAGKDDAALCLVSVAKSRGIHISDSTLNVLVKHASDRQIAIDRIRDVYPSWIPHPPRTGAQLFGRECDSVVAGRTDDVAALANRLRALRSALRSSSPPSPRALRGFMTSYQALGRTHALDLLRALAYRHSPKSAATWALTEMLHRRSRREFVQLLYVFRQHFHLVGVPHNALRSLLRTRRAKQARERVLGPRPLRSKLWPSPYHTALVWEAVVALSPTAMKETLYALLLTLVRQSRQPEPTPDAGDAGRSEVKAHLGPAAFDAAHFSPFVGAWTRGRPPARAMDVLRDMVSLGVRPTVVQWSMVARGCAQHGDSGAALGILDWMEERAREGEGDAGAASSEGLLGIHTNVLRGFVLAGDATRAREVERRLVERLGYRAGTRPRTDACLGLLRELEERIGSDPEWWVLERRPLARVDVGGFSRRNARSYPVASGVVESRLSAPVWSGRRAMRSSKWWA